MNLSKEEKNSVLKSAFKAAVIMGAIGLPIFFGPDLVMHDANYNRNIRDDIMMETGTVVGAFLGGRRVGFEVVRKGKSATPTVG